MSSKPLKIVGSVFVLCLFAFIVWFIMYSRPQPFTADVRVLGIRLDSPDVLIRSQHLSRLPADLLRVPLLRDVLSEDFVFYYENAEPRDALSGTLRRIAYEHQLTLPDRLLAGVLDEAAEVALWQGGDGRLRYFAVVMTRNTLARALEALAPLAGEDLALRSAGRLEGTESELLILGYGRDRRLLLVSQGDQVVALSDPGLLLEPRQTGDAPPEQNPEAAAFVRGLLDSHSRQPTAFARHFALDLPQARSTHEISVGAHVLALGYERFIPGVQALAFEFDGDGQWQTRGLLDSQETGPHGWDAAALWHELPFGASFCAQLPVNWQALTPIVHHQLSGTDAGDGSAEDKAPPALLTLFSNAAAVCWYDKSRLYTPIFATRLNAVPDEAQQRQFADLFSRAIGNTAEEPESQALPQGHVWQRTLHTVFGSGTTPQLKPTLAINEQMLLFSPDGALVAQALDVAAKRFPALADEMPQAGETLAIIFPETLAALVRKEVFAALPRQEESLLRNLADAHLLPRLDLLAQYRPMRLLRTAPVQGRAWQTLRWEEIRGND